MTKYDMERMGYLHNLTEAHQETSEEYEALQKLGEQLEAEYAACDLDDRQERKDRLSCLQFKASWLTATPEELEELRSLIKELFPKYYRDTIQ